jgi:hypothetical protein
MVTKQVVSFGKEPFVKQLFPGWLLHKVSQRRLKVHEEPLCVTL